MAWSRMPCYCRCSPVRAAYAHVNAGTPMSCLVRLRARARSDRPVRGDDITLTPMCSLVNTPSRAVIQWNRHSIGRYQVGGDPPGSAGGWPSTRSGRMALFRYVWLWFPRAKWLPPSPRTLTVQRVLGSAPLSSGRRSRRAEATVGVPFFRTPLRGVQVARTSTVLRGPRSAWPLTLAHVLDQVSSPVDK